MNEEDSAFDRARARRLHQEQTIVRHKRLAQWAPTVPAGKTKISNAAWRASMRALERENWVKYEDTCREGQSDVSVTTIVRWDNTCQCFLRVVIVRDKDGKIVRTHKLINQRPKKEPLTKRKLDQYLRLSPCTTPVSPRTS